jgi:predicted dehydrogenase
MKRVEECWGILGGGFGLYGYLPAVAQRTTGAIHLLQRHEKLILERSEIHELLSRTVFEANIAAIFQKCNSIVIAVPPQDQQSIVEEILENKWVGQLILEKPVAPTPALTIKLLNNLNKSEIKYRIGFTMGETKWFNQVKKYLTVHEGETIKIKIDWRFLAHHYRSGLNSWKRYPAQGGGATRFYAIHIIFILAKLGIDIPINYQRLVMAAGDEPMCNFSVANNLCSAEIVCDSRWNGQPSFKLNITAAKGDSIVIKMNNPFTEKNKKHNFTATTQNDPRVKYLENIIDSLNEIDSDSACYLRHALLWESLESKILK